MGLLEKIAGMFGGGGGRSLEELCARMGLTSAELRAVKAEYFEFTIAKRDGARRKIAAPSAELKRVQKIILRRVLGRLKCHKAVMGFERGLSFVDHAQAHAGRAVVIRIDLRDFFDSTPEKRVMAYLRGIGWGREAAREVCRLSCWKGSLPQGAPTSPRLANLVNGEMDRRLAGAAEHYQARYTRYADDLVFSRREDWPEKNRLLIDLAKVIVEDMGYKMNTKKGPRVLRGHQCQMVTGLVVNDGTVRLPRKTRRWLRAVEHRAGKGVGTASLTAGELEGWRALKGMVEKGGGAHRSNV